MASFFGRLRNAWNAFSGRDPTSYMPSNYGWFGTRPDRTRRRIQNERTFINSIYNRIAVDCSLIDVKHVRLDEKGNYSETIPDSLNQVLTLSANIDQTGRALILDFVYSILDDGCAALLATNTEGDPNLTDSFDVLDARVAKIVEWHPTEILVEAYNENTGQRQETITGKRYTPIVENPFYQIMNEPNSTLQRMTRVLNQLEQVNERSSSNKLDLIFKVPYMLKTDAKRKYVRDRKQEIQDQLSESEYGIAYIDSTEQVIQLNRAVENNLWEQYEKLKTELLDRLGVTPEILNGTADEKTMINYYSRIIEPILTFITEEIERKWLSKTARTQLQAIRFFRNPFKLVPVSQIAEIADKFTRNEIMTSNEVRSEIGMIPSKDPKADELRNSNINQGNDNPPAPPKENAEDS